MNILSALFVNVAAFCMGWWVAQTVISLKREVKILKLRIIECEKLTALNRENIATNWKALIASALFSTKKDTNNDA